MELDYRAIGGRIAKRRKELRLTQSVVAEQCDISDQYLSNIERATSIPSTEVVMRIAAALDTTPDAFLVGALACKGAEWRAAAALLQGMDERQLSLAKSFLLWLREQSL